MKRAVLKFQRDRLQGPDAEAADLDIPQTLADLREDLQCIERVIMAVERLAAARMGEETWAARKSGLLKKRAAKLRSQVVAIRPAD